MGLGLGMSKCSCPPTPAVKVVVEKQTVTKRVPGSPSPSKFTILKAEQVGPETCQVEDCRYLRERLRNRKCGLSDCEGGVLHATDANWDDYSFGHAGGYVHFTLKCDVCGSTRVWSL